jgi:hypothetical protein
MIHSPYLQSCLSWIPWPCRDSQRSAMSKGFLALYWIPKWHGLLYLCLAILAALSRVVCKERALKTRSLLIPASLACANAWAVCLPNAGAQCIPASSKSCVWPDVCAHYHACKELQPPCACSGGGSTGLRLWNSESLCRSPTRVVPPPRDTSSQQHVAGMQLCSSDIKFNFLLIANMQNKIRSRNRFALRGIANGFGQGPVSLKIKSSFHLSSSYVQ